MSRENLAKFSMTQRKIRKIASGLGHIHRIKAEIDLCSSRIYLRMKPNSINEFA